MKTEIKILMIRVLISLILATTGFFIPNIFILKLSLFLLSYIIIGYNVIKEALENIFHGEFFDENFLMFLATIGAFITGEYPEAVAVMLLYEIGEFFQDYAVDKSRDSITDLMDIRPEFANIEKDGQLIEVKPESVHIDDIIVVKAGEKIPLDGTVVEGNSQLDTSSLTGEYIPQIVNIGSTVYSGTINQTNMLKIQVSKTYENSTVSKILELVENASDKKAKAENFITKFAKIYTPIVVLFALCLVFLPPLFIKDANLLDYIHRACSFLVISCPCALVISIPLSFFAGLGGASKQGILIKGSNYIETLANLKTVVFDKTGTLTNGTFDVTNIHSNNMEKEALLKIAAYAENYSEHPIALSIKKAYGKTIDSDLVTNSKEISGKGMEVYVERNLIHIGNKNMMESIGINIEEPNEIGTIIYVAINREYAGYLVISDTIKQESKTAISRLQKNHINVVMLTGDNAEVAKQVANELSILEVYPQLLPNHKVEKLEEFIEQPNKYGKIAFAGDGINDAPVLTRADIGIAMGGLGSDAAIEAADVVIMDDTISKIEIAIKIARKTINVVRENIWFAISVKIIVLILSAFGIATMWEAVFADVGVSFLAILNAMRAFHFHQK